MDQVDPTSRLDALMLELQKMENKLQRQITKDSDVTRSDGTGCSDNDGDQTPLSHAEESAIEECLNDTEGSLSNVDLNIFDDISDDVPVHRTRKSRGQRTSERANMDFGRSGTDYESSSLDEMAPFRKSSLISMISETGKINPPQVEKARQATTHTARSFSKENIMRKNRKFSEAVKKYFENNKKRIVRRKRRNSPPIRKYDKTHIHSFFSAMADLVSTFPDEHKETAKENVYLIVEDTVEKLKEWYDNDDPNNPKHGFKLDSSEYRTLQRKVVQLSLIM